MQTFSGYDLPANHQAKPINITGSHIRDLSALVWDALIEANKDRPFLFQRAGIPTVIQTDDNGSPTLRALDADAFKGLVERVVLFEKVTGSVIEPAWAPRQLIADMMAATNKPLAVVRGISDVPVYGPNGELVTQDGYQPETSWYIHPAVALNVPPPNSDLVDRAREVLVDELLYDFPFVSQADRAAAVAAVVEPFARLMISGPTPLKLIESPSPGSGKTLLARIISIPAVGDGLALMSEVRQEDEQRKRITATLLSGARMVLLDNVRSKLDSAAYSAVLTSETWSDRELGSSRTLTLPNHACWLATANNPEVSLEIGRRSVDIRLDAGVERPWDRTGFKHDPLEEWAIEKRPGLVWAALTLIAAWIKAGRPSGSVVMGSYESYCRVMGGILDVAGIEGFLENRDRVFEQADTEIPEWTGLCESWWAQYQGALVKAADVFKIAKDEGLLLDIWSNRTDRGAPTAFGKALATHKDRVFGSYRIRSPKPDRSGVRLYQLEQLQSAGDAWDGMGSNQVEANNARVNSSGTKTSPANPGNPSGEDVIDLDF